MSEELVRASESTLYGLCDDLQCHMDTLQGIEDALTTQLPSDERAELEANRVALQANIERLGAELVKKTDSVAGVLRRIGTEQEAIKAEEQRLHARRKANARADKWLRGYMMGVMKKHNPPMTQMKTPINTLFIRSSEAVQILNSEAIPAVYMNAEVKLPLQLWQDLTNLADDYGSQALVREIQTARVQATPVLTPIKAAIKAGETIPGADLEFRESLVLR